MRHDFRVEIQHEGQTPLRRCFASPDTARDWVHRAYDAGAVVARVVRRSDGVVILDMHGNIDLPIAEYYADRSSRDHLP